VIQLPAQFFLMACWRLLGVGALVTLCLAFGVGSAWAQNANGRGAGPLIEKARGGQCVADPAFMRRNHMDLLKHQRDATVHGGVRKTPYALKDCIACHASKTTNSVSASDTNFCQSCHTYAAVSIDCFECHANKPQAKP
jgi:predicted CXXCH cytochrome family protein